MFKAGDKVIALFESVIKGTLVIGNIYTIRHITEDSFVTLLEFSEWEHYKCSRFILHSPLMEQLI